MQRRNFGSGSPWEPIVGYSRAVRLGPHVWVAGTTGTDESGRVSGDAATQARRALGIIRTALERAGASLDDVVRTRIYLRHASDWEAVGRVHAEFFGNVLPASTMLEVGGFVAPEMLVEIEADACVGG